MLALLTSQDLALASCTFHLTGSRAVTLLFGKRAPLWRPLQLEKKFLDAVRMKEVMQGHVSKHDEDGIVAVLSMCGSPSPDFRRQCPKPRNEKVSIFDVTL